MGYAVYFESSTGTFRVPVNPEEINQSRKQNNEKYHILKGGQVVVPTYVELEEYSLKRNFRMPRRIIRNLILQLLCSSC